MPKFTEVFSLGPVERYTAETLEVDITDEGKTRRERRFKSTSVGRNFESPRFRSELLMFTVNQWTFMLS
jgi:hypothetical protein